MKNAAGWFACMLLATGCGVFGSSGYDAPAATEPTSTPDREPPPPLTGTPANGELTEAFGVFVTERGSDEGDGSRSKPFATIAKAIEVAKPFGQRVYVCAGVYREAIVVEDGIAIIGGLGCAGGEWTNANETRTRIEAPTSPAVRAKGITKKTRLEGLEVLAPDATAPSGSSFALVAIDASELVLVRSRVVAGNAAGGADGTSGVQLVQTGSPTGTPGLGEGPTQIVMPPASPGGTSACAGAPGHDGESGGAGGSAGLYYAEYKAGRIPPYMWQPYANQAENNAEPGESRTGANGGNGTNGASATTLGAFGEEGFTPADGTGGSDGSPGKGGKGGDGIGPPVASVTLANGYVWRANGGSGGGAGGCPGLAGTPGKGGGASVAALLVRSAITIEKSELVAQSGGKGGRGSFGSNATPGGAPGQAPIPSASGAKGGNGGAAGVSGSGAGGPSFAIAHTGGAPRMTDAITTSGKGGDGAPAETVDDRTLAASASGAADGVRAF